MISTKDAKAFLSKNNEYKISKKDVESFWRIFSKAPVALYEGDLLGKVVYISYNDYDKLSKIYHKKTILDNLNEYLDPDYSEVKINDSTNNYPKTSFVPKSLNDAIFFQDVIPTIFYLSNNDIKKFKKEKNLIST